MAATTALQQMTILFFGIIVGFAARKLKIIDKIGSNAIVKLVMNIIMPLFILSSGITSSHSLSTSQVFYFAFAAFVCTSLAACLGLALSRLALFKESERSLCAFMCAFGNVGFMGLPIIAALFGQEAVFYATIFNLPFNILVFSIGVLMVSNKLSLDQLNIHMFINPCFIVSLLAIALYLLGIQLPEIASDCLDTIGQATIPLAMLITGSSLAEESPREVFGHVSLYVLTLAKNFAVPLISFVVLSLMLNDTSLVKVGVVLMGMPVAVNATMLCIEYGGNERLASRGVFLSTLLSIVSIPLLCVCVG